MKDRVFAALLTVIVFAAGFWAGRWHESRRPVPPPPGAFLGEFGPGGTRSFSAHPWINRARLAAEIEKIKPQLEAFRTRLSEIDAQFESDLEKVLTPDQRKTRENFLKRHVDGLRAHGGVSGGDKPLTDGEIASLQRGPLFTVFRSVVLPMRLDQLTRELKLDDTQREQVRDLLRVHREKFLELVDSAPPPSVTLSRLAPLAQRLSYPPSAPAKEP